MGIQIIDRLGKSESTRPNLIQSQEIYDLKERIVLLERKLREQEREINDYREREQGLLDEIESLHEENRLLSLKASGNKMGTTVIEPRLIIGFDKSEEVSKGLAENWEAFMYAFTDEVFLSSGKPDLLLYNDGLSYTNPNRTVFLKMPVTQEDLDRYNILSVRPLTEEELDDIGHQYDLL